MVTVRGSLAKRNAGGPQFKYIPQRIVVEVGDGTSISDIANSADDITDKAIDNLPVEDTLITEVSNKLEQLEFNTRILSNTGVIIAETDRLSTVVDNIRSYSGEISDAAIRQVESLKSKAQNSESVSILNAFRPGLFNFEDDSSAELEANLRNELLGDITNPVTNAVEDITGVVKAEVSHTVNTPGPKNLGLDVDALDVLSGESDKPNLGDAVKKIKGEKAWQVDTGSGAVVAIFDTSFSEEFVKSNRVIDTFYGDDVESAYSAPEEGHGTMTAYSAGGNKEDTSDGEGGNKVNYSGVAKDADLLLARLTDSSGAMVYTEEAWDWLAGWIKTLDKPVISNHSYGIPLCSGRSQNLCSSVQANISEALSSRSDHQAIYAAGNEAQYCGHRLSGFTNGITGTNSKPSSIAVAAFRFEGNGAQTYSSHGFGTCTSVRQNPKPDVGSLLPSIVPYGNKEKDLSTPDGGSGAGTSEAAPLTAGVAALVASITGNARQEVIEGILESSAKQPRKTQVNIVRGHDARFGHGQIDADESVRQAKILEEQEPPNAVFTFEPEQPTVGDEVTFDASASTDPNEDIESYQWDFGDGETATGVTATHVFEEFGTQSVILTVTDSTQSTDTFTQEVDVNAEPEANFEIEPDTLTVNEVVTLDAGPTVDPDNDVEEYEWNLGEGSIASGETLQFQYNSIGEYTIELTVTDSVGNTDSVSRTVTVTAPPEPEFNIQPSSPVEGDTVTFDASASSDPDRDITSYQWVIAEDTTARGSVVEETFEEYGTYEVTLTVEDSVGNTSTTTEDIVVGAVPEPEFNVTPSVPTTSDSVQFDASSTTDPDGTIDQYIWDFGDGEQSVGEVTEKMYDSPGDYEVMLTVEDSTGNVESTTQMVRVLEETGDPGGGSGPETGSDEGEGGDGDFATQEQRQEVIRE